MKIAILGTKGIPGTYGGFETLAENLAINLSKDKNLEITVFCSGRKNSRTYKGIKLRYIPLGANKFQGIIYDLICIILSIYTYDKILLLGSPAGPFLDLIPNLKSKLVFNYGGLDFNRSKWPLIIQKFIAYGKKRALYNSQYVIADNRGIYEFIKQNYSYDQRKLKIIEYGADHVKQITKAIEPGIVKFRTYSLTIARIQQDNNIELILKAAINYEFNCVIIGNWNFSKWGKRLKIKYQEYQNIELLDPIYDLEQLYALRKNCQFYIHGHSAGGTNPTLVEAMYLGLEIFAFDNSFNRYTTENECYYWKTYHDLGSLINKFSSNELLSKKNKLKDIGEQRYNWERISNLYYEVLTTM